MNFVNQHKYRDSELEIYRYTKKWAPMTIVELGYGSGALTVAMAMATNSNSIIHSYDLLSPDSAIQHLKERKLINKCSLIQGDVAATYLKAPFKFDMLLIDIHNTWHIIYDIVINNAFINSQIRNGSIVVIEGGADLHPRINKNTLNEFHSTIHKEVFSFEHISGLRTSLSILTLL